MTQAPENPEQLLQPGTKAPNFSLPIGPDEDVSLRDYRGRPVILVFYPADWSPVCGNQIALYNEILPEFEKHNAAILGISIDTIWSHLAYSEHLNLHFPLLSDFHPKGEVAKKYGVYREEDGTTERALFVIDSDGIVRWSFISPGGVNGTNPGAEGILKALENLKEKQEEH